MKKKLKIEDRYDYRIKLDDEISLNLLQYAKDNEMTFPDTVRMVIRKFFNIKEPKEKTDNNSENG